MSNGDKPSSKDAIEQKIKEQLRPHSNDPITAEKEEEALQIIRDLVNITKKGQKPRGLWQLWR